METEQGLLEVGGTSAVSGLLLELTFVQPVGLGLAALKSSMEGGSAQRQSFK